MLETLNKYTLIFLLFFLPLLFPPVFTDLYDAPKILFFYFGSFILIFLFAFLIRLKKEVFLPDKNFLILLGLFGFIYLLSSVFSIHPLTSFIGLWDLVGSTYTGGLIYISIMFFLFFIALNLVSKKIQFLEEIAIYLSSSAFLISLYGIYQYYHKFLNNNSGYRIRSTIGEPNRLAYFLVSILPISLAIFFSQKKAVFRFFGFISSLAIFIAIVLTFSRGSWLALFLTFLVFIFSNLKSLKSFYKKGLNYFLLFLVVVLSFFYFRQVPIISRITNVARDLNNHQGSTYLRLMEWQAGFKVFNSQSLLRKIIGTGPETVKYTYPKFRPVKINEFSPDKNWQTLVLRNQYLQYLNTIGIAGLFLYLFLILIIIRKHSGIKNKTALQKGFFYAWLAIILSSVFYYQTVFTYPLFWVFSAIVLSSNGLKQNKFKKSLFLKTFLAAAIIYSIFGIFTSLLVAGSLRYAKNNQLEKAIKLTPFFDFLLRSHSKTLQEKAYSENNKEIMNKAIFAAQKAYQINSLDINNLKVYQASLYKAAGYLKMDKKYQEQALILAQKWAETDPSNPAAFDSLGLSFLDLGRLEDAQTNFEKALKLDGDFRVSYLHMGEALKQKGEVEKAIEYYRLALEKHPDWQEAKKELDKALILLDN